MAHPAYLREKARSLRIERKLTIDELAARLSPSRTTIYYWVRDLPIPASGPRGGWPESARREGNRAMRRKYRLLREAAYQEGLERFDELARDASFRDFLCLYIAEGAKRSRNDISICNSDDAVLSVAVRWMRLLTDKPLSFRLQYHADQDLAEVCRFWGALLGVAPDAIGLQRKSNSGNLAGRHWRSRYGVLTVRVCDTLFRARLQAWMDRLRSEWTGESG